MYTEFYKLRGKPFQLSPNPRFYFASEGHQKAMAYLRYGLDQGEGFIVITGDVGTGKTTLLGHLLSQLDEATYRTATLVTTQVGADDTLRLVASAFGIDASGIDKANLLRRFERLLGENQQQGRRMLLLVNEVQNLPMNSLEELRMLSNFQPGDIAPIQFCLVGQPQFRGTLASEHLMQLRQRVIASYHLGPLNPEETQNYVEHRLRMVNWQADPVISDKAFGLIHQYSSGIPRQINTLSDRLLLYGMLEGLHRIDEQVVEDVAGEMLREGTRTERDIHALIRQPSASPGDPTMGTDLPAVRGVGNTPEAIESRVSALEMLVRAHDKALKRALSLAAQYFSGAMTGGDAKG